MLIAQRPCSRSALRWSCLMRCLVLHIAQGVKWSATKWVHVGRYAVAGETAQKVERVIYAPPPPPATPGCINKHKL